MNRNTLSIAILTIGVVTLLHYSGFSLPHNEGDELVYLSLANKMTWFFGNYTTQDVPYVNEFHLKLYRAPLFVHPPLFPYLLKILSMLGDPVKLGLVLNLLIHAAIVWVSRSLGSLSGLKAEYLDISTLLVLFCPVVFLTTHKIHMDAFFSLGLMTTALLLMRSLTHNEDRQFVWAGIAAGITMNIKVNGPFALLLPLPILWCISKKTKSTSALFTLWLKFMIPACLIGLPHYLHLWVEYGFSGVRELFADELPLSPYVRMIRARNWAQLIVHILLLSPITCFVLMASFWTTGWDWLKQRRVQGCIFGYWFLFFIAGMMRFRAEKYWVIFLPLTTVMILLLLQGKRILSTSTGRLAMGTITFLTVAATAVKAAVMPASVLALPFLTFINQTVLRFLNAS